MTPSHALILATSIPNELSRIQYTISFPAFSFATSTLRHSSSSILFFYLRIFHAPFLYIGVRDEEEREEREWDEKK